MNSFARSHEKMTPDHHSTATTRTTTLNKYRLRHVGDASSASTAVTARPIARTNAFDLRVYHSRNEISRFTIWTPKCMTPSYMALRRFLTGRATSCQNFNIARHMRTVRDADVTVAATG